MKQKRTILLALLVLLTGTAWAQTTGEAGLASKGELPDGYFAASNDYPRNTILQVVNPQTGASVKVRVLKRLESALDSRSLLLSDQAGKDLGFMGPESLKLSMKVDSSLEGLRSSLMEDRAQNPDPEINPLTSNNLVTGPSTPGTTSANTTGPAATGPSMALNPSNSTKLGSNPTLPSGSEKISSATGPVATGPSMALNPTNPNKLGSHPTLPSGSEKIASTSGPLAGPSMALNPSTGTFGTQTLPSVPDRSRVSPPVIRTSAGASLTALVPPPGEAAVDSGRAGPSLVYPGKALLPLALLPTLPSAVTEEKPWLGPRFYLPAVGALTALLLPEMLPVEERPYITDPVQIPLLQNTAFANLMYPDAPGLPQRPLAVSSPVAPLDTQAWVTLMMPEMHVVAEAGHLVLAPEGYDPSVGETASDLNGKMVFLPPRETGPREFPSASSAVVMTGRTNPPLITPLPEEVPTSVSPSPAAGSPSTAVASTLPSVPEKWTPGRASTSPSVAVTPSHTTASTVVKPTFSTLGPGTAVTTNNPPTNATNTVSTLTSRPSAVPQTPYSPVEAPLKGSLLGNLPVISGFEPKGDYIIVAVFKDERQLLRTLDRVRSHIPLSLMVKNGEYRLVAGPVKRDQTGFLLNAYQTQGFKQAQVVKGAR